MTGFAEKPHGDGGWINGGFFVLEPGVERYLGDDATVWEREPMEGLARDDQLSPTPRRLLAADGHPARAAPAAGAVGVRARAVEGVVDAAFWRGRRVLVTGHTGFKGAWLSLWLQALGAEVTGFSDAVPTEPSLFELAGVGAGMRDLRGDVRDPAARPRGGRGRRRSSCTWRRSRSCGAPTRSRARPSRST